VHPHLVMLSWAHMTPYPKTARFSRFCTARGREYLYFIIGRPFLPQSCSYAWGILTPSNTWFLEGTSESTTQTASQTVQPFCRAHDRDRPTDRQTDRATPSVAIGRIYVHSLLRCGLIIITHLHGSARVLYGRRRKKWRMAKFNHTTRINPLTGHHLNLRR